MSSVEVRMRVVPVVEAAVMGRLGVNSAVLAAAGGRGPWALVVRRLAMGDVLAVLILELYTVSLRDETKSV